VIVIRQYKKQKEKNDQKKNRIFMVALVPIVVLVGTFADGPVIRCLQVPRPEARQL
jgi:hypothetical protein